VVISKRQTLATVKVAIQRRAEAQARESKSCCAKPNVAALRSGPAERAPIARCCSFPAMAKYQKTEGLIARRLGVSNAAPPPRAAGRAPGVLAFPDPAPDRQVMRRR